MYEVSTRVKDELKAYVASQKAKKTNDGLVDLADEEEDDEVIEIPTQQNKRQKTNVKGPLDVMWSKGKGKQVQTSIKDACNKEIRAQTIQSIAAFFYQAGVAFNVANMNCLKEMLAAVGNYGPHLKPPSYHELRVPLLNNEVQHVEEWVETHRTEWMKYGCSVKSDGWTDRKQRTLINFLVNGSKGTVFMESVDASSYMKTGEKVFELLDGFVERIGEQNVVQVITDNGANFKLAGKMLMEKRKNLFWTPCAAHCLDLMLEDIGKIPDVKKTIEQAIFVVGYIYNHSFVLNLMREFTKNNELTRSGVTRFATTFLTLQSLQKQKSALRNMFASEQWTTSKWAEERKGARANDIVFTPTFFLEQCPVYVYEGMERAKTAIAAALGGEDNAEYIR
ncbi:uncharacterized protein LOC110919653 [Helianthus annuus]|uniref:uncharacterized protein LOC110919653 n=1 Tax=Helianthus annuus TaxID=4232 RepID=UPI0016533B53|nr:uncharacterized protein LOC110919653 [Helianthus annuus]